MIDTGRQHKQLELLQGQGRCSVGGVGGGWMLTEISKPGCQPEKENSIHPPNPGDELRLTGLTKLTRLRYMKEINWFDILTIIIHHLHIAVFV